VLRIRSLVGAAGLAVGVSLAGCGFIGAGHVSHTKPDGFILHGYVRVAGSVAHGAGTCTSPAGAADVRPGAPVLVSDPAGKALANGTLSPGTLDPGGNCNFPFEIRAVPGGPGTYVITVGGRPPASFPATELRQNKPAVIEVRR
jgi:hypothetical protein